MRVMGATRGALATQLDGDDYARVEAAARSVKRGVWVGDFAMPWEWRQLTAR